ncbi:MAG: ABC transporter ATP-binding protein, partial [Clostridia bacterium]|nr:ABC transporter ATP-binding protein [Clostridia bacterium]
FTSLRVVTWIVSPIFAAKVTVALMDNNFTEAMINLAIEFGIVFIGFVCWDLVYRNAGSIIKNTYKYVQGKIYKKAYRAKTSNFKTTSKEKLLNIIGTDVDVICNFGDTLGVKIGRVVQVLVTLVIVFVANWVIGFAILGVSALNFFVLLALNKNIAKKKKKVYENKDKLYENFSRVLSDQDIIKEFDMGPEIAEKYFKRCDKYSKSLAVHKNACSLKDNYFVGLYKFLIFAITLFMILLVQSGALTLVLYFTLVPYLLSSVELINEIINISASIEETDVSTKRINTILNFTDEEFVQYGNLNHYEYKNNLTLMNVYYKNEDKDSIFGADLNGVDLTFNTGVFSIVKGVRLSGKRSIFNLITRKIVPASGIIMLNDINIIKYDKQTYKNEVFAAYSKPKFLDDSIISNFNIVEKDKDKIYEICEVLGIKNIIVNLPNGFDTNINDAGLSAIELFLIDLAMSCLRTTEFLCIYELPATINEQEEQMLKTAIVNFIELKSTILFTHEDMFDKYASVIYKIENGKVAEKIER